MEYSAAIQGDFSVDQNGSATYSIAVQVPPGTAGMQPSLALLYHSTVTDGMLGVGWNLQGLSAITRCAQTPAQDQAAARAALHYDDRDRFMLDGQRLMVTTGEYGAPGARYATELESFREVTTLHAPGQSAVLGFIVVDKDGMRYNYGATDDSRILAGAAGSPVRVWALSRMTDRHGNFLTFTYRRDPLTAAYYPLAIDYTGNTHLTPQRQVRFEYEPRPRQHPRFEAGHRIDSTLRLTALSTTVLDQPVLRYTLAYGQNQASGRSQLQSVVYADAAGATVLPTRFDWLDLAHAGFDAPVPLASAVLKSGSTVIPLDVGGSGRRDLAGVTRVSTGGIALQLLKSTDTGYAGGTQVFPALPWSDYGLLPLDMDGDGRTELLHVGQRAGKLVLTLLTPREKDGVWGYEQGTFAGAGPDNLPYGGVLVPMDVNGDGRVDLVYCYADAKQNLQLQTLLSNGAGFEAGQLTPSTLRYAPTAQLIPVEFDGDGMTDLLYAYADQAQGKPRLGLRVFVSNGRGFLPAANPLADDVALPWGGALMPMRLKEDAQDDLVYALAGADAKLNVYTLFGTGTGFQLLDKTPLKTGISYNGWVLPSAARGAGMSELLVATQAAGGTLATQMMRWNGSGFDAPVACLPSAAAPLRWGGQLIPADVTGRGKTDLLYGLRNAGSDMHFQVYAAPASTPGRLCRIHDGYGGSIEIGYRPLTDGAVYAKGDAAAADTVEAQALLNGGIGGTAWPMTPGATALARGTQGATYALTSRQFPEYVVAEYAIHDNRGQRYGFRYRYSGCRVDMTGRGWLGFATREAINLDEDTALIEQYQQRFPATGLVASATLKRASDGALLSRSRSSLTITGGELAMTRPALVAWQGRRGNGVYRTEVTGVVRQHFTPGRAEPDLTETESNTYDGHGNVIGCCAAASNRPPRYHQRRFDTVPGRRGLLLAEQSSTDAEGKQVLQRSSFQYDPVTGAQTGRKVWDDVHGRELETRWEYDAYGNRTAEIDCSGARTSTHYDTLFHTFCARQVSAANVAGETAEVRVVHEPHFGQELSRTDANGQQWRQRIDGLGRVVETLGPGPDGETVALVRKQWGRDGAGFYTETRQRVDWSGERWYWRRNYHDALGREHRIAALPPDQQRPLLVDRTHTLAGQVLTASQPYFEGDPVNLIERRFDALGRVVYEIEPTANAAPRVIHHSYPRIDRAVRDEGGRISTSDYIKYGEEPALVRQVDAEGAVCTYAYDVLGRMTSATDPAGTVTRSRYDSLGRRIALTVEGPTRAFAGESVVRDDILRTVKISSPSGHNIEILRDGRNRVVERKDGAGVTRWQYDAAAGRRAVDRLACVLMPEGQSYTYSYDTLGQVCDEVLALAGEQWRTRREYGPAGNLLSVTHPDGSTLHHSYTTAGQLSALDFHEADGGATRVATFADFTPLMRPRTVSYGNGLVECFEFASTGQLRSQALRRQQTPLAHTGFHWDQQHQLTRIDDHVRAARSQQFRYDRVGRLLAAERGGVASVFAYDLCGNLLLKDGVAYSYEGQQVVAGSKDGQQLFGGSYDADGNLRRASHGGQADSYQYDGLGRLTAAGAASFQYDHTGRRLLKKSAASTTLYVTAEFEATLFANGARLYTRHVAGAHGAVAQITRAASAAVAPRIAGVPSPGIRYVHTNQVNSSSLHTGPDGRITGEVEYRPFGEVAGLEGEDDFRHKFTGKEFDSETGLYYFHARYYDPRLGRFISGDDRAGGEFGGADVMNRYAYVLNSPLTGIDFDGHFRWDIVLDVVLAVAAVTLIAAASIATAGAAGAALGLAGSTLLGAAVSGSFSSAAQSGGDFSWGQWGTEVGIGGATGFLSGGINGGGVVAGLKLGLNLAGRVALGAVVGSAAGVASGVAGTGLRNAAAGRAAGDGMGAAAIQGVWMGAITGTASALANVYVKGAVVKYAAARSIGGGSIAVAGIGVSAGAVLGAAIIYSHERRAEGAARSAPASWGKGIAGLGRLMPPSSEPSLKFTPAY
jgi:RHS repeat-associated protein